VDRYDRDEPILYGRIGTRLVAAREFVGVPVNKRPAVWCPATGRRLSIKAGKQLTPHMARRGILNNDGLRPETVRHINAKGHLLYAIREATQLSILVPCAGAPDTNGRNRSCNNKIRTLAAWDWTNVLIEAELNNRIPDGRIERHGCPVLLLEFVATNPVSWEKERDLALLDAPTLEVTAEPSFFEGPARWSHNKPLVVRRVIPEFFAPRCPAHASAYRTHCKSEFGIAGLPLYRYVDVRLPDGNQQRSVFRVDALQEGAEGDVRWTLRRDGATVTSELALSWLSARIAIDHAFECVLRFIRRDRGAVVLPAPSWLAYPALNHFSPVYLHDRVLWPMLKLRPRRVG
jgi:hypothetical protein